MIDPLGIENASSGVARRIPLNTAPFNAKVGKQVGKDVASYAKYFRTRT